MNDTERDTFEKLIKRSNQLEAYAQSLEKRISILECNKALNKAMSYDVKEDLEKGFKMICPNCKG